MVHIQCIVHSFVHSYQTSQKYGQSIDTQESPMKITGFSLDLCKERTGSDTEKPTGTSEAHKQQSKVK